MEDSYIINQIKSYSNKNNIKTTGILVIKIEVNRIGHFCVLVIDFDKNVILQNYPYPNELSSFSEKTIGSFLVCYKDGLKGFDGINNAGDDSNLSNQGTPFCCNSIKPYKEEKLDREDYFIDFINKSGNHDNVVFEVKTNVNFKSVHSTKYYKLVKSEYKEVKGPFKTKIHAFKNYKCAAHNLFFAVDIYSENDKAPIHNSHHMRLNPYTHKDEEVLNLFFKEC